MSSFFKYVQKKAEVSVRFRLVFLWALASTGAILLAKLAPLPSTGATVALYVTLVILAMFFGVWVKKETGYFHHKWRWFPLPSSRQRKIHYTIPGGIISLMVSGPTLWLTAYATWGEGFYKFMAGMFYALVGLLVMLIITMAIWIWIDSRKKKANEATNITYQQARNQYKSQLAEETKRRLKRIQDDYEVQLAQAAEREAALKNRLDKLEDRARRTFSGAFIRMLTELTLERQSGLKPDKFRGEVRKTLEHTLEVYYGRKIADEIVRNNVWSLMKGETFEETMPDPDPTAN